MMVKNAFNSMLNQSEGNSHTGILYNNSRYSIFKNGNINIKFKTSPYLDRYISILKWDNGYIECMAKYSTNAEPVEEYIDLRYIAARLGLPDNTFENITEVVVK